MNDTIDVEIVNLKITTEDSWSKNWVVSHSDSVYRSPHYLYLQGNGQPMLDWLTFRKLPVDYLARPLIKILVSILKEGQKEPIKIYKDGRINTGHKRAAAMAYLGHKKIKATVVEDNYKL